MTLAPSTSGVLMENSPAPDAVPVATSRLFTNNRMGAFAIAVPLIVIGFEVVLATGAVSVGAAGPAGNVAPSRLCSSFSVAAS